MKCFFCKTYFNPKREGSYSAIFYTTGGFLRRLTWCKTCDKTRPEEIDKEYDRRQAIDDNYILHNRGI